MRKFTFLVIIMLVFVVGCSGFNPQPYEIPEDCKNTAKESIIMEEFSDDPRALANAVKLVSTGIVIESDCHECVQEVIDALETADNLLQTNATWFELGIYLNSMFDFLEDKYDVVIILATQFVNDMGVEYTGVIPERDICLLRESIKDNIQILMVGA